MPPTIDAMAVAPADADWTSIPPAVTLGGVFGQILHAEPSDPSTDQAVLHALKLHGLYGEWLALLPPESMTRRWRDDLRAVQVAATGVAATSATASRALAAAGIPHVVYKGVAMAAQMGFDWRLRRSADVDVLVPPEHIGSALDALRDVGWAQEEDAGVPSPAQFWAGCEITLKGPAFEIDLHWRPNVSPLALRIPVEELISRREEVVVAGARVPTLNADCSALVTVAHGGRSMWFMGKWILDLARTLASTDPAELRRRAGQVGAQKSLALGCAALTELDQGAVPAALQPSAKVMNLWQQMRSRPISLLRRGVLKSRSADSVGSELDAFSRLVVQRLLRAYETVK